MAEKLFAFVLMPFSKDFDDIYRLGIKQTAERSGLIAERVDEQFYTEGMLERIYNQIEAADIIVADMTGRNPNVFYEVGYAHAKEKLCLLLTQDAADIPFDLKHHQHIVYGGSITGLQTSLEKAFKAVAHLAAERSKIPFDVELTNIDGILDKNKYSATANVWMKFDFHNRNSKASPDIEQIYMYTGNGWSFKNKEATCPSTASDLPDYTRRHFIEPPARRLQRSAWAQLRLDCSKTLASVYAGDEVKDKYRLSGGVLLRVITSDGAIDYKYNLDFEVEELPF